jgi:hypothetical protein
MKLQPVDRRSKFLASSHLATPLIQYLVVGDIMMLLTSVLSKNHVETHPNAGLVAAGAKAEADATMRAADTIFMVSGVY